MVGHFSLERVNRAPASFDPKKMLAFQERYMQALPEEQTVEMVLPYLRKAHLVPDPPPESFRPLLLRVVEAAGDRIKVAGDILDYSGFFVADAELPYDEKAFEKRLRKPAEAAGLLAALRTELAAVERFDEAALEGLLRGFVEARAIKLGQVIHALRVAVTGTAVGFGLYESLAILGRDRCLARIDRALALV